MLGSLWFSTVQCKAPLPSASLMLRMLGVAKGSICARGALALQAAISLSSCCYEVSIVGLFSSDSSRPVPQKGN